MAITSGTVICPAYCATLGSQACNCGNDEITFPNTFSTCCNGNTGGACEPTPNFGGRLVLIRQGSCTEESRYVGANVTGNRFKVHEDWCTQPAACDTVDVSYIIGDMMCDGASRLDSGSPNNYRICNQHVIGNAMVFSFYADLDGAFKEYIKQCGTARGSASMLVCDCARYDVGYIAAGKPTSGIEHKFLTCNSGGATALTVDCCAEANLNATYLQANRPMTIEDDGTGLWCTAIISNLGDTMSLPNATTTYKNTIFEGSGGACDTIDIGACVVLCNTTLSNTAGFLSTNGAPETICVNDVIFLPNNSQLLEVRGNKTWNINDPAWNPDTSNQCDINFISACSNIVNENFTANSFVTDETGSAVACAKHWVVRTSNDLSAPSTNRQLTNACGNVSSRVLKRTFNCGASCTLTIVTHSDFAIKIFNYNDQPFVSSQAMTQKTALTPVMIPDANICQTVQATAITAGSGILVTQDASTPFAIVSYTAGDGDPLDCGDTITGTCSCTTGIVREVVTGTECGTGSVFVENVSGTFTNAEAITSNGCPAWAGTSDQTANPQQCFTWGINGNNLTLQINYDYLAARMATVPACIVCTPACGLPFLSTIIWGEDENGYIVQAQGGCSYKTERTVRSTEGVMMWNYGAGSISKFTDDAGGTFIPPATVTLTVTVLEKEDLTAIAGARVHIARQSDNTEIMNATTNGSGVASTSFNYTADVDIFVRVREETEIYDKLAGTITSTGFNLTFLAPDDPKYTPT